MPLTLGYIHREHSAYFVFHNRQVAQRRSQRGPRFPRRRRRTHSSRKVLEREMQGIQRPNLDMQRLNQNRGCYYLWVLKTMSECEATSFVLFAEISFYPKQNPQPGLLIFSFPSFSIPFSLSFPFLSLLFFSFSFPVSVHLMLKQKTRAFTKRPHAAPASPGSVRGVLVEVGYWEEHGLEAQR